MKSLLDSTSTTAVPAIDSSAPTLIDSISADNFLFTDAIADTIGTPIAPPAQNDAQTDLMATTISLEGNTLGDVTAIGLDGVTNSSQDGTTSSDVHIAPIANLQPNDSLAIAMSPSNGGQGSAVFQPAVQSSPPTFTADSTFAAGPLDTNATAVAGNSNDVSAHAGLDADPSDGGSLIGTAVSGASQALGGATQIANNVLAPAAAAVLSGGVSPFVINVTYDASVNSAPAGFTAVINSVIQYLESQFTDHVTLNIDIGYGEVNGNALETNALGENTTYLNSYSYAQVKTALTADATSADDLTAVATLPLTSPVSGTYWVSQGEAKAIGLLGASTNVDGYAGFAAGNLFDFDNSNGVTAGQYDFYDVVAHEITEIMGRSLLVGGTIGSTPNGYYPLDLFHYSSAGVRDFVGTQPGYFSFDAGLTNLDNFNTVSGGDFGDWASSVGNDSYLAFSSSGVINPISVNDLREMDVLGWDRAAAILQPDLTASNFAFDGTTATFHVNNFGLGTAASSTAGIYLSTDSVITNADTLLATAATPSLITQTFANESASLTLPSNLTPGTYYLGALADYNGHVAESNESDNGSNTIPVVLGNASNNNLTGTAGNDFMFGFAGNDTLNGGAGADTMYGGAGNDTYVVDNTGDQVIESANQGTDTVQASVSFTLAANVENLTLTGSAAINGTGNTLNNVITGNAGSNQLTGGGGKDQFVFNTALNAASNVDTVTDFSHAAGDKIDLAHAIFTALTNEPSGAPIAASNFHASADGSAQNANQHVLYNTTTGALSYDPDGSGHAAAVQFATIANHPTLVASDFLLT